MKVSGKEYRTVWMKDNYVYMIEQNLLPFEFKIFKSESYLDTCVAIRTMIVRGAGAIGASAGFAMAQAAIEMAKNTHYQESLTNAKQKIEATRPTAQNLFMATARVYEAALISVQNAVKEAEAIADEDSFASQQIGNFGNSLIKNGMSIETHCNAGWLAFVDHGTALSPIYAAHREGKKVFVYVDETRPRSQGARLTAWELMNESVPHQIIPDNAGAFLMSQKKIDMIIVGADRIAANGDTANKIGTLEKAIAAKYYGIPFYVAAPTSTIDVNCPTGKEIPIEYRSMDEVLFQTGADTDGKIRTIQVASPKSEALNPAFDVTPSELITAIITEKGIIRANNDEINKLFSK